MALVKLDTGEERNTDVSNKNLLCTECKQEGKNVKTETLNNLLNDSIKYKISENNNYYACTNYDCSISYFSEKNSFFIDDTRVKIWYKDDGSDVSICYCSKLSRGEITEAVKKDYDTIEKVREYSGKNITGNCTIENPLGICCHKDFKKIIDELK